MKIELTKIKVRDLVDGYKNSQEEGVVAFHGLLNVRPPYQREYCYNEKQRDAVIDTVVKGYPLNTMYWVKNEDGTYELLDGQQRTLSICQYCNRDFSVEFEKGTPLYFNAESEMCKDILEYELYVYVCSGNHKEKIEWFKTINTAGEPLTDQELLNINYIGPWLSDAKSKFSKTNCVAYRLANKYVKGAPIRQEYLETALDWISDGHIGDYMADHQHDANASVLWSYFQDVISWVTSRFTTYRKEMLGLPWGKLYNKYHDNVYDTDELEREVHDLMENEEVTDKKGIYEYLLSGKDKSLAKKLSKRTFAKSDVRTAYERQGGICPICGQHFDIEEMHADHIMPWTKGGKTVVDNLQMLCSHCNATKSDNY